MTLPRSTWGYFLFVALVSAGWCLFVFSGARSALDIYAAGWPIAATMVVGAFIAGATSEGGGAIAFPVMTLLLAIAPADARVFSLGIQSFGMTAATLLILGRGIPIAGRCLLPVTLGGYIGFMVGDTWLVDLVSPPTTKLFFVSLWLGFGFALFLIQRSTGVNQNVRLPDSLGRKDHMVFLLFGLAGGAVSAMFGNGIDILTFTLLTLYYRVDVRIATPTSVVLMTAMTVFGFLWHLLVTRSVTYEVETYLLACIPVCIIMAPLGTYVISRIGSAPITWFLYLVIAAQFATAYAVIVPSGQQLAVSLAVALISAGVFYSLGLRGKRRRTLAQ